MEAKSARQIRLETLGSSLRLDINNLAAKGSQDLLDRRILSDGLPSLFLYATLLVLR